MADEEKIKALRLEIDAIDERLVRLLCDRARVAREIGIAKGGVGIYRPQREKIVLERAVQNAKNYGSILTADAVATLYREIMRACRSVEKD